VARELSTVLAAEGQDITSFFRNPEHAADVAAAGATPVVLDLEKATTAEIAEALAGHDAVVWSAGAGGGNPDRTYAVDRDAAIRSMDAAAQSGIRRYVMVSYFGAGPDHGVPADNPFFHYAEAKAAADSYLRGTSLDWTILCPGALTDGPGTGLAKSRHRPRQRRPRRCGRPGVARRGQPDHRVPRWRSAHRGSLGGGGLGRRDSSGGPIKW
jgi:uncharacterized protein YbjT (DUF2867 family)